ncbi:MAG: BrnT family toxin [Leptolyngbyaceae cyanobacterium]
MDVYFVLNGITFVWNDEKAQINPQKHDGVTFQQAAEAFFDPLLVVVDASRNDEVRDAIIGLDRRWNLLYVVFIEREDDMSVLFQLVKPPARNVNTMKTDVLKKRLDRNRPMTTITIRMPEDVIEDLKRIAPLLGFSGYQPLARAYIGQGLRTDLERLEGDTVSALIASLKRHGVSDEILQEALGEVTQK